MSSGSGLPGASPAPGFTDSNMAGETPPPASRSEAAGGVSLPCLNSNNGNEAIEKKLQGNARKSAYALRFNVQQMADAFGIENLGFLTLTFAENIQDPKEAYRRFHSLMTGVLNEKYPAWIRVFERQKSGRIHYHLLVNVNKDIRTGVNWAEFEKGVYRSAGDDLRSEWAFWRNTAKDYGFGRTELLPIKSTSEAIANYVGKYIAKHFDVRKKEDKGVRLVGYSAGASKASVKFAWVSPRAWLFRKKLATMAELTGVKDSDELKQYFGAKWGYFAQNQVMDIDLAGMPNGVKYPSRAVAVADGKEVPQELDKGEIECKTSQTYVVNKIYSFRELANIRQAKKILDALKDSSITNDITIPITIPNEEKLLRFTESHAHLFSKPKKSEKFMNSADIVTQLRRAYAHAQDNGDQHFMDKVADILKDWESGSINEVWLFRRANKLLMVHHGEGLSEVQPF